MPPRVVTGPSPRETLAAQLTRDPQPLHEAMPGIPRTLSDLIMRCLAKDPDKRPQRVLTTTGLFVQGFSSSITATASVFQSTISTATTGVQVNANGNLGTAAHKIANNIITGNTTGIAIAERTVMMKQTVISSAIVAPRSVGSGRSGWRRENASRRLTS